MKLIHHILLGILASTAVASSADVPEAINYQGRLTDASGNPVTENVVMTFSIYDSASGGTVLYSETSSVDVVDGVYQTQIGNDTPLDALLFSGGERWLQLSINGVPANSRTRILAVPYAMLARNSQDAQALANEVALLQTLVSELQSRTDSLESTAYAGLPPPPQGLSAITLSSRSIAISWNNFDQVQESGFIIERKIGEGGSFLELATLPADTTTFFDTGLLPGTGYTYRVCAFNSFGSSSYSAASTVTYPPGPHPCNGTIDVIAVDSPTVHAVANLPIQIFTHGLSPENPAAEVALVADDFTETILVFTSSDPSVLSAQVPAGLSAGSWDVRVVAANGDCGILVDGLNILSGFSMAIESIEPQFVPVSAATPATITGTGMIYGAEAYLIPSTGGLAIQLESPGLEGNKLHGTVPATMLPGTYDVLVVNPDGTAGVRASALTVLTNGVPEIEAVTLSYFISSSGQQLNILGQGFVTPVAVSIDCVSPSGGGVQLTPSVISASSTALTIQFDASAVEPGSVCIVTVRNPDGGAARSAPITAATPSLSANSWALAAPLNVARRRPSVVGTVLPDGSGRIYAIGGDSGNSSASYVSVESVAVDALGRLGTWRYESSQLPAGRSFASAVKAGAFIYLTGGYVGAVPSASVLRAMLLDEAPVPGMPNAVISYDGGAVPGVSAGIANYRISALYPLSDSANPGGESLAGGNTQISIPAVSNLVVSLSWPAVPGAVGYKIFKSNASGGYELLAAVSSSMNSYTDDGTVVPDPGQNPLPAGSLGKWHAVASMAIARVGHAVAVAPVPINPSLYAIYAIGGNNQAGSALASIERMIVDGTGQIALSWSSLPVSLSAARSDLGTWLMKSSDSPSIPGGEYWLYIGPGSSGAGSVTTVEGTKVQPDGTLNIPAVTDSVGANWIGYAAYVAKNQLNIVSGNNGASTAARGASPTGIFPDLTTWNALSAGLNQARRFSGSTQINGCLFIVGGSDSVGGALSSVERSVK